jgi:hypothetical protein
MLKDAQRVTKSEEGVTMQQIADELECDVVPNLEPHTADCIIKLSTLMKGG